MRNFLKSFKENPDTGFGSAASDEGRRFLNKDGTFNVRKTGGSFFERLSLYHTLMMLSWPRFLLVIVASLTLINMFFAFVYLVLGPGRLVGLSGSSDFQRQVDAFAFSVQTFATVGYGRVNPQGILANLITSAESLLGVLSFAIVTGLLYGHFSRPVARILFSRNALISPYRGITGLMFRMANAKNNQLIEVETEINLSMKVEENGAQVRKFFTLSLERKVINFLALSWTVVHPIDDKSPLFGIKQADFEKSDAELMIMIKAYDDTYETTVHRRHSYKFNEVVWGAKFVKMFQPSENRESTQLDLNKLGVFEEAKLPS